MATTEEPLLTAEEYGRLPDNGYPTELVRGRVVQLEIPGFRHGKTCGSICFMFSSLLDDDDIGHLLCSNAGFITERGPDTVRGPDVSFYSYARIPKDAEVAGYPSVSPEVVFEVRSPSDRWPKILEKVSEYLNAGVLAVYVVDPQTESVTHYDADQPGRSFSGDDELTFPEPLAGLRLPVRSLFQR